MALLNIGASNSDDAFYRYKMPKMVTKIEGRGNGIKTNIVNMVDVAKALGRPASYTTKYFGCELGAQSKFDQKTGTSLVNGAHDTAKLADLLENFIKKYVQCYGCGNPETDILISKTQMISLKCAACGFISDVDMRDKLTSFIIKNPPEVKKSKDKKAMRRAEKERLKEGEAIDEEQRKLKKESKKKAAGTATTKTSKKKANGSDEEHSSPGGSQAGDADIPEEEEDDDVEWQTDTSAAAAQQRMREQLSAVTAEMVVLSTTEEKKPPTPKPAKKDVISETASEIKNKLKEGMKPSELKSSVGSLAGTSQEVMNAIFEALFGGAGKGFSNEVAKKKPYMMAVVKDEESQMLLLRAIEDFCGKCSAEALKEVALAIKGLYDGDVLEEEIIVKWYEEGVAGANKGAPIWKNVKPFVEWLQNADSESEEE
ncbi:hypothetical protein LUZ61_007825 [Rhynchospora tenuis]|uniref:W2 domain-containing protein n=1 Tax=Rhynchospora tenuis TaxID=198213 RepID=A0AAD5ZU58_9POAL|nr:hypothetical protein LUZ61_007825 [Rhynchospora tenuis]